MTPDERGAEGGQDVDENEGALDRDAGEERRAQAVADAVDAAAEGRAAEKRGGEKDKEREDGDDRGHAEEPAGHQPAQHRRGESGGRALGVEERRALQDAIGGQRHDDGRDAEPDDTDAVGEADQGTEAEDERKRVEEGGVGAVDDAGEENAGEADGPRARRGRGRR